MAPPERGKSENDWVGIGCCLLACDQADEYEPGNPPAGWVYHGAEDDGYGWYCPAHAHLHWPEVARV